MRRHPPYRWLFGVLLTSVLAFTALRSQPFPILEVSPPPDTTGVWLGTSIRVTFAMPMDRTSVETRFRIDPPVSGTFVWQMGERGGERLEFRPKDILAPATTYRVTLQAGLRDASGEVVLDTDYTWTFTTGSAFDALEFGRGLPVQLVDPAGRNRVRLWTGYPRMRVGFALYALPETEFVTRYSQLQPWRDDPIDVSGLTQVAAWQQDFGEGGSDSAPGPSGGGSTEVQEAVLPAVPSGIYVLVARHPYAGQDEVYVVVSRYVLALKQGATPQPPSQGGSPPNGGRGVVAWAVRLQDQTPASGMRITLYDGEGISLVQGTTDANGVVTLDPRAGARAEARAPRLAVGQLGNAITLAGLDGAWRTQGGYWYWWWGGGGGADGYRVYLYTDRPIYRPGQTVHFAAILRHDEDGRYTPVGASQPVTATLRDSRRNVVATQVLTPDDFGTVHGDFTLGLEPPMGDYRIELELEARTFSQSFRVEAYRKPEYQVEVATDVPFAVAGDDVTVAVAADYFFGQPVAGAEVVLRVFRRGDRYWWYGEQQVAELRGTTDADGRWTTVFTTDGALGHDAIYTFVATVTDASRQPVEGRQAISVCWNSFRLTLRTDKYGYQPGEPVMVRIGAQRHDGTPVADQPVTVTLWRNYPEPQVVAQEDVTTDAQGRAEITFADLPQGWYRLSAEAVDDRDRKVQAWRYLWIYTRSGVWWYASEDELRVSADREAYAPGDTAQLLIESRVTGVALLTVERGSVYEERIVTLDGPVTTVALPVRDDFAPNVFVFVQLFKPDAEADPGYRSTSEGKLLVARTELPVSAEGHRLSLQVTPDAEQYRPGAQATFTIQVTDAAGAPVEALVSLALVDEAIFALSEDRSADLFDTFYGPRPHGVTTYDSLTPRRYFWGYPEDGRGGGGPTPTPTGTAVPTATPGPTAPLETSGQSLRREFRDTAYWNPAIRTDAAGRAVVTVTLPHNLTTWRVIARAVTHDTKVGSFTTHILVTQEIIARPALPRFAVRGDAFALDTIAQNFSGQDLTGTVRLEAPSLVVLDPGVRRVTLPNTGTAVARWTAVAADVGTGRITSTVETSAGSDAVELPLPIKPFAVPERWAAAGRADPVAVERFTVPFNAVHEATTLTLRLTPSDALGVLDGLDALIDYPYGCVEQTMSRVLPTAVAARVYHKLGLPNPKAEELPQIIAQGLQRLYGFQHPDGSWGWWYDDEGGVYMTAYVLFGLTMVQEAGFQVDPGVLERGFAFLDGRLSGVDDPRVAAYALYVKSVAGRGDLAATQRLLPQQEKLDPFARAALALTLAAVGDVESAQALVDILIAEAVETPLTAYWPAERGGSYGWHTMSSTAKNTAMALRALVALRPDHRLVPKVVRWLMEHRRGVGWGDTQATAFAVLALTDYLEAFPEFMGDYTYTVTLNERVIASGQVTPETVTTPIEPIVVPGTELRSGANELRIQRDGPGQLYYSLILHMALFYDGFEPVSSVEQGLVVTRTYRLADGVPREDGAYNVGDLVEVVLTLETRDELWYVVVEDPLPAGFEALNERINPVTYGDFPTWHWYEWGYNRKDIYDDRVAFFVTHLWPGRHVLTYLMRATTPGEFSALPAQAYPMYVPEIWGRSGSQRVRIAPEALVARPPLAGDVDWDCRVSAFDLRQVAAAYGMELPSRDVDGDGDVDLRDVAWVAARQGAACGVDREPPVAGEGFVRLAVVPEVRSISVGRAMRVEVLLQEATTEFGGFGLVLRFDAARLRVAEVRLDPALADGLPLGPFIDNAVGRVAFGVLGTSLPLTPGSPLASVTFVGQGVGETALEATSAEVVDAELQLVAAEATAPGSVTVAEARRFLPLLRR